MEKTGEDKDDILQGEDIEVEHVTEEEEEVVYDLDEGDNIFKEGRGHDWALSQCHSFILNLGA